MNHTQLRILIADDDDGHAMLIQEHLEDAGIQNPIRRFRDGQEIWDFLTVKAGSDYDPKHEYMLLLDIRMPKLDGVEVLRRIKGDPSLHAIPVIMLTTTDDPREVAECYALGCNSYVTKPINFEDFTEVIHRLGLFVEVMAVAPPRVSVKKAPP